MPSICACAVREGEEVSRTSNSSAWYEQGAASVRAGHAREIRTKGRSRHAQEFYESTFDRVVAHYGIELPDTTGLPVVSESRTDPSDQDVDVRYACGAVGSRWSQAR